MTPKFTTGRASHSLLLRHPQLLLLVQSRGCPEPALEGFLLAPSVPLKTLTNAYQRHNSELGVSAAGSNLADVPSVHPPKLTGQRARVK